MSSQTEKEVQDVENLLARLRTHVEQEELKGITHGLCYWCIEVIERLKGVK